MAVKSIVDIDINDAAFNRFRQNWAAYQAQLAKTGQTWQSINQNIAGATNLEKLLTYQAVVQTEQLRIQKKLYEDNVKGHGIVSSRLREQVQSWKDIGKWSRDAAATVAGYARVAAIGLAGAGAVFGLDRLAGSLAAGRKSALGLGVTYGQQKAFGNAYDRILENAQGFLANVADLQTRPGGLGPTASLLGLGAKDVQGDAATAASKILDNLRARAQANPQQMQWLLRTGQLGQLGLSSQDLRRLISAGPDEWKQVRNQFLTGQKQLNVLDPSLKKWQDFLTQLDFAGDKIKAVLGDKLADLAPSLTKLSDAIVSSLGTLISNVSPKDIETIGKAFEWLASKIAYLVSPKARTQTGLVGDLLKAGGAPEWTYNPPSIGHLEVKAANAIAGILSGNESFSDRFGAWSSANASAGSLPIKPGAGTLSPGWAAFLQNIPDIKQVTAGADAYHKGFQSAHNEGRAVDFTLKDPNQAEAVADMVRKELKQLGVEGKVIIEGYGGHPMSKNATAPHVHVQVKSTVRLEGAAGAGLWPAVNAAAAGQGGG